MSELLNLVGLSTGVVLYAMLLAMVMRAGARPGDVALRPAAARDGGAGSGLEPLRAARVRAAEGRHRRTVSASDRRRVLGARVPAGRRRAFGAARRARRQCRGGLKRVDRGRGVRREHDRRGCCTSTPRGRATPLPSPLGMRLLTYAFIALVVPLAAVTRGQPGARRALWAAALSIFAVSALHLSQLHQGDASWPVELLGHHAVAAAGVRDPVSGLSVRARRPVPEARADAHRAGRAPRCWASRRSARSTRRTCRSAIRATSACSSRSGSRPLCSTRSCAIGSRWFVDTLLLDRPDYAPLRADIGRRAQQQQDIAGAARRRLCRSSRRR